MNFKKITVIVTAIVIPALIVAILIYDAVAVSIDGNEASISSLIITMSYKQPLIPALSCWFIGLLQGHLFWRMKGNNDTRALNLDVENNQEKSHK